MTTVVAVMVMARAMEVVMAVQVTASVKMPTVVAMMRPVLHLFDGVARRRSRFSRDRERSGLCGAGRRGEPEAGHRNRQGGGLDHGLSCACKHCRKLPFT